jgi:hypothetical protein
MKIKRAWLFVALIPFLVFFAAGAVLGWWLIEKDAGRYLRDFGKDQPESDFYYSALVTGALLGTAGAGLGLGGYGCYRLIRRPSQKSER